MRKLMTCTSCSIVGILKSRRNAHKTLVVKLLWKQRSDTNKVVRMCDGWNCLRIVVLAVLKIQVLVSESQFYIMFGTVEKQGTGTLLGLPQHISSWGWVCGCYTTPKQDRASVFLIAANVGNSLHGYGTHPDWSLYHQSSHNQHRDNLI